MKASTSAAILAYCAALSSAAPVPAAVTDERPWLPGRGHFKGEDEFGQPQVIPGNIKRNLQHSGVNERLWPDSPFKFDEPFPEDGPKHKREALGPIVNSDDLGFDPSFSLRCLDGADLSCNEKREAEPALGLGAGVRAGLKLGKELFFDDKKKRAADPGFIDDLKSDWEQVKGSWGDIIDGKPPDGVIVSRDAQFDLKSLIPDFSKANPNDDSPFNPFDDPGFPGKAKRDPQFDLKGLIPDFGKGNPNDDSPFNPFDDPGLPGKAKRDAQFDLKSLIPDFSKANPNDDSPFNPFDDPGLPGKAKRDAQFDLKSLIPDFSKANPNDDSPFNPFDDPGLPGKRDADPLLNLPVVGDLGNLPVVGKLPVVGDLLNGQEKSNAQSQQQQKREADALLNLPVVGDLGNLPVVGKLPVVGDLLGGQDSGNAQTQQQQKREAVADGSDLLGKIPVVGQFLNFDKNDQSSTNPIDGLIGK
ncbi:hypothetical protein Slin15195_G003220 [Septoria linicola]|uniref:Uncharacterized protein n=1 Tax=Septoria linicola TaxID=215465 RepID=A0A9Q9AHJ0_9PEZI|nr:hypothetical protein Slin14017_G003250 [Septoria linicola]USW47003.1 hypothetical protein Slin15195_G003220 [Septoria linicola]